MNIMSPMIIVTAGPGRIRMTYPGPQNLMGSVIKGEIRSGIRQEL
jgi:hypothetical protein